MTYAELKAAILKVRAAVESRDPLAAFAAVGEFVRLAGEFFGATTFAVAADGKAELVGCVDDLKAACSAADATPQLGGGLWGTLVFEIIKIVVDRLKK